MRPRRSPSGHFSTPWFPVCSRTEGYARAVLERHPNVTSEQVAERLAARLSRQAVLERTDPPLLWVLLDENVLLRRVGGATIMHDQITHLAAMARRPNITIQLISREGAHVGLTGAFAMAETADAFVAHLEHIADGLMTDSPGGLFRPFGRSAGQPRLR